MNDFKITERITEEIIQKVLQIKNEKGLTAETFLEEAEKKKSPLHALFPEKYWNDTFAARQYRLQKSREYINEIIVIIDEKPYPAFENVHVTIEKDESIRQYEFKQIILNDEDMRKEMLQGALDKLKYWQNQYRIYKEFEKLTKYIDEFLSEYA